MRRTSATDAAYAFSTIAHRLTNGGECRVVEVRLSEREYGELINAARKSSETPGVFLAGLFRSPFGAVGLADDERNALVAEIAERRSRIIALESEVASLRRFKDSMGWNSDLLNRMNKAEACVVELTDSLAEASAELKRRAAVIAELQATTAALAPTPPARTMPNRRRPS
jgi:hypothetical protein